METPDTVVRLAQPLRKTVLKSLLVLTLVAGIMFFILNVHHGLYALAMVELAMAGYSTVLLVIIRNTRHLERWILAFILPFFSAMMFAMYTPRATDSVFAWALLIPILSHLLLGRRTGFVVALFFMLVSVLIFFDKNYDNPELMQATPLANLSILSLVIFTLSHAYEVSRERTEQTLYRMANTDFLTGLANRTRFRDIFEREKRRARRNHAPMAVLLLDLDFFKSINDDHGHDVGDSALVFVARMLVRRLRTTDLICRLGGEEFGIILTDTDSRRAMMVAEELRAGLARSPMVVEDAEITMTMSIGIAELGLDGETLRDLLAAADRLLYQAKADGRNRIAVRGDRVPGGPWPESVNPDYVTVSG